MTNAKLTTIAVALWVGGFAATAALAYTVNRPLTLAAAAPVTEPEVVPAVLGPIAQEQPSPEPMRWIVMPTVEIVAKAYHAPPPHHRDISEMRCHAWRPLSQGSNSVQICD
jgi:hypothetical protein